jgi:hypothetical protein
VSNEFTAPQASAGNSQKRVGDTMRDRLARAIRLQKWMDFWLSAGLLFMLTIGGCYYFSVPLGAFLPISAVIGAGATWAALLAWGGANTELTESFCEVHAADGKGPAQIRELYYQSYPLHRFLHTAKQSSRYFADEAWRAKG